MAPVLYRLGHFCVRRRYVVLGLWAVLVVALVALSFSLGSKASDNLSLPGTGSQKATDLLTERFPSQANGTSPIVVHTDTGDMVSGSNQDAVNKAISIARASDIVEAVVSPYDPAGAAQVSKDKKTVYFSVAEGLDRHVHDRADRGSSPTSRRRWTTPSSTTPAARWGRRSPSRARTAAR